VAGPSLRREAEELKTLAPPEEDEAEVDQLVESLLAAGKGFEDEDSKEALRHLSEFEDETSAYGFKLCAPER
jgi:hypothetical protein